MAKPDIKFKDTTERKPNSELSSEERERITVVAALRNPGSTVLRGTLDTLSHAMAIAAAAPAGFVTETFISQKGWTVVSHPALEPKK